MNPKTIQIILAVIGGGVILYWSAPAMQSMQGRAQYEQTLTIMKEIDGALIRDRRARGGYANATSIAELSTLLGRPIQEKDAWGNAITYRLHGSGYVLGSPGADGVWDHEGAAPPAADAHRSFEADIIVRNSMVVHGRYAGVDLRQFQRPD